MQSAAVCNYCVLIGKFLGLRKQRKPKNKPPEASKPKTLGSGMDEDENWILSNVALLTYGGREKSNCPV